jgi:hypothetical protein
MEEVMGKEIKKLAAKSNRSMLKLWSFLLMLLLGALGILSGCNVFNPFVVEYGGNPVPEYGVQVSKYIVDQTQNQNAE